MPETKTFKNEPSGFANGQPIIGWRMSTGDVFSSHEWDMEVTFTRKALNLIPGSTYYHVSRYGRSVVTVIAVHEGSVWYEDTDGDYYIDSAINFEVLD